MRKIARKARAGVVAKKSTREEKVEREKLKEEEIKFRFEGKEEKKDNRNNRKLREEEFLAEDIAAANFGEFVATPLEVPAEEASESLEETALGIPIQRAAAAAARGDEDYVPRRRAREEEGAGGVDYAGRGGAGREYVGRSEYASEEPMYGASYEARYQTSYEPTRERGAQITTGSSELDRIFHRNGDETREGGRIFMPETVEQRREFGVQEMLGLEMPEKYVKRERKRKTA